MTEKIMEKKMIFDFDLAASIDETESKSVARVLYALGYVMLSVATGLSILIAVLTWAVKYLGL